MQIFLTGATGYVGSHLLPQLLNAGHRVVSLARSEVDLPGEVVKGDVLDLPSLINAMKGADVAYYFIHSMASKKDFEELDRQAATNFAKAASVCGVKRIIYLGGLGEQQSALSPHLRSRHEVGEILRSSSALVIEFRASIVIGAGSLSFEMVRALCERLPFMITPKWVFAKAQPIAISDLLTYLIKALTVPLDKSIQVEIGGKDTVSYADIMGEYSKQRGLKRLMIPVPVLTPYLSSLWLGLVTPLYAQVGRKLIESACHPTIVQKEEEIFSIKTMGISESIKEALDQEEGGRIIDERSITISAVPEKAFAPILRIGGFTGWYWGNWLWKLRGFLDTCLGGVGLRRGRLNPDAIEIGDHLDFWIVENYIPNQLLRLRAEMKVPGEAWLEFEIKGASTIYQRAIFHPRGLLGLLYWYMLYPLHVLVFQGMLEGIAKKAEE